MKKSCENCHFDLGFAQGCKLGYKNNLYCSEHTKSNKPSYELLEAQNAELMKALEELGNIKNKPVSNSLKLRQLNNLIGKTLSKIKGQTTTK